MNTLIFRSYDIRGIYGRDLTADIAKKIGIAIGNYLQSYIAVARDMRNSSKAVMDGVVSGILSAGKNVFDLGLLPFGPGMFYAWRRGLAFVHITASHLPAEWGGIKIFHSSGASLIDKEIYNIRDMIMKNKLVTKESGKLQNVDNKSVLKEYRNYLVSKLKPAKKMRIVVDCGNGMAGLIARDLFESAGFDVNVLFEELDGSFPNRSSEPTDESLAALKSSVDGGIGIAYDGDGDRTVFVDERGRTLKAEQLAAAMLNDLAQATKGPVVANVECTRMMEHVADKFALHLQRIRVGHPYLVKEATRLGAILGVEDAGHFIIPSLLPFGDAIAVSLFAACMLSRAKNRLADIVDALPTFHAKKLKFACSDRNKFAVIENLTKSLAKAYKNISTIDGVRVDMSSGWMLVRASNTESTIRLTMEAVSDSELAAMEKRFAPIVQQEIKKLDKSA